MALNYTALQGRLAADPELKYTQNSIPVASFRIAVNRDVKDGSGNYPTDWINIVAWRKTAEFAAQYFKRGSEVIVTGRLQTRAYDAADGSKRTATEVVADRIYFSGSRQGAEASYGEFQEVEDDSLPF